VKLPNKAAENNLGLSLVDIRVIPTKPFYPHAKPILGTNGGMNTIGVGEPSTMDGTSSCGQAGEEKEYRISNKECRISNPTEALQMVENPPAVSNAFPRSYFGKKVFLSELSA